MCNNHKFVNNGRRKETRKYKKNFYELSVTLDKIQEHLQSLDTFSVVTVNTRLDFQKKEKKTPFKLYDVFD